MKLQGVKREFYDITVRMKSMAVAIKFQKQQNHMRYATRIKYKIILVRKHKDKKNPS